MYSVKEWDQIEYRSVCRCVPFWLVSAKLSYLVPFIINKGTTQTTETTNTTKVLKIASLIFIFEIIKMIGRKTGVSKMINCVVGRTSVASPSANPVATAAKIVG